MPCFNKQCMIPQNSGKAVIVIENKMYIFPRRCSRLTQNDRCINIRLRQCNHRVPLHLPHVPLNNLCISRRLNIKNEHTLSDSLPQFLHQPLRSHNTSTLTQQIIYQNDLFPFCLNALKCILFHLKTIGSIVLGIKNVNHFPWQLPFLPDWDDRKGQSGCYDGSEEKASSFKTDNC